ncbi:MAG: LysR substrate-binding domain-containing protein [Pseudomonadota bacterium]
MKGNTRQLSLRGLRTFCTAARALSYRRAAEQLFVTPSAVSHQIKRLEEELGVSLFERVNATLALTPDGELLFQEIDRPMREIDGAAMRIQTRRDRVTLSLSVQPFFASELFIPRLAGFTHEHPDIDLSVNTSDESLEHHPGDADASIRLFRQVPTGLSATPLFPLRLVPACTAEFREAYISDEETYGSDIPLIVHNTREDAWRLWYEARGLSMPPNQRLVKLDSMIAVVRAAERGLGVALVPIPLADAWFESGAIVRLPGKSLVTEDFYYLVYDANSGNVDQVRLLHDWVLQTFASAA